MTISTHIIARAAFASLAAVALTACQLPNLDLAVLSSTATPPALSELRVTAEQANTGYDRDDWPHWSSHGDGCDTRDLVLFAEGRNVVEGEDCEPVEGTWTSAYDGVVVHDPGELDIDHIVPLAEAAESGAHTWTEDQRERYANDRRYLIAVTASSNRTKGDADPAEWLPAPAARCDYTRRWIATKTTYGLTVDPAERAALANVLEQC